MKTIAALLLAVSAFGQSDVPAHVVELSSEEKLYLDQAESAYNDSAKKYAVIYQHVKSQYCHDVSSCIIDDTHEHIIILFPHANTIQPEEKDDDDDTPTIFNKVKWKH